MKSWQRLSLKAVLLGWLVPGLVLIMGLTLWRSNQLLRQEVDAAYDRALAGALRAIDLNVSTASGGLAVEQPFVLLEFFELTTNARVYFRVATEDGLAEIGSPFLPLPAEPLRTGEPRFYYAMHEDTPVRVAALARPATPPLPNNPTTRIVLQVAESVGTREVFLHQLLRRSIERDLIGIAMSVVLLIVGVVVALRPLTRLQRELEARAADDLRPIDDTGVPTEVRPLVAAVNRHMARYADMARAQRQFLDDASHQLRTPLSVLRTQVDYALREHDMAEVHRALQAMHEGLDRAVRMVNQMLALARARDASLTLQSWVRETVDLSALACEVVRLQLPQARSKRLDLGVEAPDNGPLIHGCEWMLREAVANLLDNAIRYTPEGGSITVAVRSHSGCVWIEIEDQGPGMTPHDITLAGTRFRRGTAGKALPGAGLGLAIVHTIAQAHGARLELRNRTDGRTGLVAALVFSLGGPAHSES